MVPGFELAEQAHVLDRDHALVGECLEERDLLLGERPRLARVVASRHGNRADGFAATQHRHHDHRAIVTHLREPSDWLGGIGHDVCHMRDRTCPNRAGRQRVGGGQRHGVDATQLLQRLGGHAVVRGRVNEHAVEAEHGAVGPVTHADGTLRDRVEDRLRVGRRRRDRAKNLTGRHLLLERLGELPVSRLELLEQPHVLDRDHRLRGKGLQERDLPVGEGSRRVPSHRDRPDGFALPEKRRGQDRARIGPGCSCWSFGILVPGRPHVRDMDGRPVEHRPTGGHPTAELDLLRQPRAMHRHRAEDLALQPVRHDVVGAAQAGGALGHHVHHGPQIGRRAGDDAQYLCHRRLLLQRLRQLDVPRLELGEQAHVLDRDHRLVGERLDELDVSRRELPGGTRDGQHPNCTVLAEHWHAPVATGSRSASRTRGSWRTRSDPCPRHGRGRPSSRVPPGPISAPVRVPSGRRAS